MAMYIVSSTSIRAMPCQVGLVRTPCSPNQYEELRIRWDGHGMYRVCKVPRQNSDGCQGTIHFRMQKTGLQGRPIGAQSGAGTAETRV